MPNEIQLLECKKHGLTEFKQRKDNRWRCLKCQVEATQNRRNNLKKLALEYKGNKCSICGYDKCSAALEFHHCNNEKDFGIAAKGYTRSWAKVKEELDKCILVCANCHRELHFNKK